MRKKQFKYKKDIIPFEDLFQIILSHTPNHYEVLGLKLFESDKKTIHKAGLNQTKKVKEWELHPEPETAKKVLAMRSMVSKALVVLEDKEKKTEYDKELSEKLGVPISNNQESSQGIQDIVPPTSQQTIQIIIKAITIVMLFIALVPSNPYGYYIFLRWICCVSYAYIAYAYLTKPQKNFGFFFILGAIVYNPIVPLRFSREVWVFINIISIILTGISFWFNSGSKKLSEDLKWS